MNNYIIKIVCGEHFVDGLNEEIMPDRVINISGLDIEEFKPSMEVIAMNVFKNVVRKNMENQKSMNEYIANGYIYDANNDFVFGIEVDMSNDKVNTTKYSKEVVKALENFKK